VDAVELDDAGDDGVEEGPVVADGEDAARIGEQPLMQPRRPVRVQVVGGFVEQQDVRGVEQRTGQHQPGLFAAGHLAQGQVAGQVVEAEALPDLLQAGLGRPPLQGGPPVLDAAVLVEHVVAALQRRRQLPQPAGHGGQFAQARGQERADRGVRVGDVLGEVADPRARAAGHRPRRGRQLAGQHPQQGGLAGAVGADQADPAAGAEHQIDIREEQIAVMGEADRDSFEQGVLRGQAKPTRSTATRTRHGRRRGTGRVGITREARLLELGGAETRRRGRFPGWRAPGPAATDLPPPAMTAAMPIPVR
jgi:hypothetical protein